MKAPVGLLTVALLTAGCMTEEEECPSWMHQSRSGCVFSDTAGFSVQVTGSGPYAAEVPYPRLACLDGKDWLAGLRDASNLTLALQDVEAGEAVRLEGNVTGRFSASVPLGGRRGCSTAEATRWSLAQDAPDVALAVQVDGAAALTVTVSMALGTCDGDPAAGAEPQLVRVQEFKGEARDGAGRLAKTFDRSLCQ